MNLIVALAAVALITSGCKKDEPSSSSASSSSGSSQTTSSSGSSQATSSSGSTAGDSSVSEDGAAPIALRLLSPPNGPLAKDHGCSGADTSPAVSFEHEPIAPSYAVVVVDESIPAPNTHWVLYDLKERALAASMPTGYAIPDDVVKGGAHQTASSFSKTLGYFGPCPPSGTHNYRFTVHALDVAALPVTSASTIAEVVAAIEAHSKASSSNVATYVKQ